MFSDELRSGTASGFIRNFHGTSKRLQLQDIIYNHGRKLEARPRLFLNRGIYTYAESRAIGSTSARDLIQRDPTEDRTHIRIKITADDV